MPLQAGHLSDLPKGLSRLYFLLLGPLFFLVDTPWVGLGPHCLVVLSNVQNPRVTQLKKKKKTKKWSSKSSCHSPCLARVKPRAWSSSPRSPLPPRGIRIGVGFAPRRRRPCPHTVARHIKGHLPTSLDSSILTSSYLDFTPVPPFPSTGRAAASHHLRHHPQPHEIQEPSPRVPSTRGEEEGNPSN